MKKLFDEVPYCEGSRVVLKRVSAEDKGPLTYMVNSRNVYRLLEEYRGRGIATETLGLILNQCLRISGYGEVNHESSSNKSK